MQLESLQLNNYRNYAEARVSFTSKVNVLVGKNGSGKTNLLDAIFFLATTRSAVAPSDQYGVRLGQEHFYIKGVFLREGEKHEVSAGYQKGAKKIIREDGYEYQKFSDHVGKYPVVLIAPDDTDLVREASESRRRFFDSVIAQADKDYLEALINYNQALRQRNGLLKMFHESGRFDPVALEVYDDMLVRHGSIVFQKRRDFLVEFGPVFQYYYNYIVAEETAEVIYRSALLEKSFETGLRENLERDRWLQRTSFGIHRDDFNFLLGGGDLKRLGSQGQQKSFVIALRLAQFAVLKNHKGFPPLLLLDDIFDKLDDFRIEKLLELLRKDELGQLFITDARPDRTAMLLERIEVDSTVFSVGEGNIRMYA